MKRYIKKFFRSFGYDIVRFYPGSSIECFIIELMNKHHIDFVLDIGANEGQYGAFLLHNGYKNTILSFEPLSAAHKMLSETANKHSKWNIAEKMAIGDIDGSIIINVSQNLASSSILPILNIHTSVEPKSQYIQKEEVKIQRLDSLKAIQTIPENCSIMIKIDTQGYEDKVLNGALNLLKRVKIIQLELSLVPLYEDQPLWSDLVKWLDEKGFQLVGLFPGFTDSSNVQMLQAEGVFLRSN